MDQQYTKEIVGPATEFTFDQAKANIDRLLKGKRSFEIVGLSGKLMEASQFVETAVEERGMTCRVYTRNRVAAAAGATLLAGEGILSLAAIAAHNLVTFNPDYEIGRAVVDNKLYVDYKKG